MKKKRKNKKNKNKKTKKKLEIPNISNNKIDNCEQDNDINGKKTTDLSDEEIKLIHEIYINYEINFSDKNIKNNDQMELKILI